MCRHRIYSLITVATGSLQTKHVVCSLLFLVNKQLCPHFASFVTASTLALYRHLQTQVYIPACSYKPSYSMRSSVQLFEWSYRGCTKSCSFQATTNTSRHHAQAHCAAFGEQTSEQQSFD